jgi:hypothetical protein
MNSRLQSNFVSGARICEPRLPARGRSQVRRSAFTLMEVMIAMGIFFIAIFAILELVSSCLRNARLIQKEHMDTRPIMTALYQTNKYLEGIDSGQFDGWDLNWETDIERDELQGSNGLYRVQATISGRGGTPETNWVMIWGEPPPVNGLPR